jgi:hypothetical protein
MPMSASLSLDRIEFEIISNLNQDQDPSIYYGLLAIKHKLMSFML